MLDCQNDKYFRICDNCGDVKEIKKGTYKSNMKKDTHFCVSCNQKRATLMASKKPVWNKGLTKDTDERVKKYNEKQSITKKGKEPWNKGLTKEDDIRIKKYGISNSKTKKGYYHTLQYFIDKYGEIEGLNKYNKLNSKKALIPKNFINKYGNQLGMIKFNIYLNSIKCPFYSKISQELFWDIYNNLNNKEHIYFSELNKEFGLMDKKNNTYYFYDFVDTSNKKVIEFNGDYFHANPSKFTELDTPNPYNKTITSKDIWESDNKKINAIENLGYKVLIVWENDFKNNKEKIIKECISFLS